MRDALLVSEYAGLLILGALLGFVAVTWFRYRAIAHKRMTALCAYSVVTDGVPSSWRHGVLRYGGVHVNVFTLAGMSRTPVLQWPWRDLQLGAPLDVPGPSGLESGDVVVLPTTHSDLEIRLAMTRQSYLGLRAWLESAPPGTATSS